METETSRTFRILHLDDEVGNHYLVKAILGSKYNYLITHVDTLDEMLDKLATESYDLLLTDTEIGSETILDYIDSIVSIYPKLIIIGLSGNPDYRYRWLQLISKFGNNVFAFVSKPYHVAELESKVALALEIKASHEKQTPL